MGPFNARIQKMAENAAKAQAKLRRAAEKEGKLTEKKRITNARRNHVALTHAQQQKRIKQQQLDHANALDKAMAFSRLKNLHLARANAAVKHEDQLRFAKRDYAEKQRALRRAKDAMAADKIESARVAAANAKAGALAAVSQASGDAQQAEQATLKSKDAASKAKAALQRMEVRVDRIQQQLHKAIRKSNTFKSKIVRQKEVQTRLKRDADSVFEAKQASGNSLYKASNKLRMAKRTESNLRLARLAASNRYHRAIAERSDASVTAKAKSRSNLLKASFRNARRAAKDAMDSRASAHKARVHLKARYDRANSAVSGAQKRSEHLSARKAKLKERTKMLRIKLSSAKKALQAAKAKAASRTAAMQANKLKAKQAKAKQTGMQQMAAKTPSRY